MSLSMIKCTSCSVCLHSHLIYEIIEFLFPMSLLIVSFVSFLAEVHKRTRGKTLMNRVHTRPVDKRIPLNMNKRFQPISDDDKVISEIGYFIGTLKRCVPLTYKSWRDVPEKLKTTLLNYVKPKDSDGALFVKTRKRKADRTYKTDGKVNKLIIDKIEKAWVLIYQDQLKVLMTSY